MKFYLSEKAQSGIEWAILILLIGIFLYIVWQIVKRAMGMCNDMYPWRCFP